jgi:hypothetical protein
MVYKIRKTKGRYPQESKTNQREIPIEEHYNIVVKSINK